MSNELIDQMDVTTELYKEAMSQTDTTKKPHTLYIWNVTPEGYDFVICESEDGIPDVVPELYFKRDFIYKEKPHE